MLLHNLVWDEVTRAQIGSAIIVLTCFLLGLNFFIIINVTLRPCLKKQCYWRYLKWSKVQSFKARTKG